ncbi:hypothetical protein [Arenibaculum pallidiluteum]|uniref:hypothetical protein n=1 Tax=Arenibaculum pallidiluteum TaxID=2812559 RepID=UPI001A961E01|nr:hypothetical protein [Arenibaculum pallidiluteum]
MERSLAVTTGGSPRGLRGIPSGIRDQRRGLAANPIRCGLDFPKVADPFRSNKKGS